MCQQATIRGGALVIVHLGQGALLGTRILTTEHGRTYLCYEADAACRLRPLGFGERIVWQYSILRTLRTGRQRKR
jgi:hypothetical protein